MNAYRQSVAFLESFINYEQHRGRMTYTTRALHIRRFEHFLHRIGSPHLATPCVHIAGTKGKGSTAALLHSVAIAAGLKAGLYTSPHLDSYCERIRIGRHAVSESDFADAVLSLKHRIESSGGRLEPGYRTTFELLTTAAFEMFRDCGVQLAVIETGLGGRLDATNVVLPEAAVITAIGLDHTHILGRTHTAIAREKGGIIKPGRPAVIARQPAGHARAILDCLYDIARRRDASAVYAPRRVRLIERRTSTGHGALSAAGQKVRYRLRSSERDLVLNLPLAGLHQAENLRTVLATVEVLRERGWGIPDTAVRSGVRRVSWPGRIEYLGGRPPLILDGAHCPLSAAALADALRESWPEHRPVFLFSLLDDKPVEAVAGPIACAFPGAPVVVFRAPGPRGCPAEILAATLRTIGVVAETADTALDALRKGRRRAAPNSILVAFGSLYSIAPLRKAFQKLTNVGQW
ncbi:MAG: Mur ligase family protein [Candidatus Sumerlaeia bacterium]|nr:Mur ligase family protein [Candidatus Sumerlaeia bacterium]